MYNHMPKITISTARLAGYQYHDRYPDRVTAEFTAFLSDAKAMYPNLIFRRSSPLAAWIQFKPSDPYAVAKISYEDVRLRRARDSADVLTYNLYSRTFYNSAVSSDRIEHHMKKSKSPQAILKDIGTYTKALTTHELVRLTADDVATSIYEFFGPMIRKKKLLSNKIGVLSNSAAEQYVLNMARSDKSTLPPTLSDVGDFADVHSELELFNLNARRVCAVCADEPLIRVLTVPTRLTYEGAPALAADRLDITDPSAVEVYCPSQLPSVIADRLNALRIVENMEFVPNVGIKHSDTVFYVVI